MFRTIREDRESAKRLEKVATSRASELMQEHLRRWGLTASEADVAALTVKGCGASDIAMARNSREGAIKSRLNAIYRKW